jgi:2-hydroxymuconate-semialdehyde hydrolase
LQGKADLAQRRKLIPEGIEERWALIDAHRMRYLTGGSGPPLLLIHGLMGFSFSWSECLPELARHFTVFAPDLFNLGYSDRCDTGTSLREIGRDVFAFMDTAGLERAAVIGTSHGGGVALQMAMDHPERVSKLMLVDAANPFSERWRWQIALFSRPIGRYLAPLVAFTPRWFYAYGILLRMYADRRKAPHGTVEGYWRAVRWDLKTHRHLARVVMSWTEDFRTLQANLRSIAERVPTILLWGDKDVLVPIATAHELQHAMGGVPLIEFPGVGHLPYEESPTEFSRAVIAWMKDNSSQR